MIKLRAAFKTWSADKLRARGAPLDGADFALIAQIETDAMLGS